MTIRTAQSASDIDEVKRLFREYAESLDYDLCFQNFEQELAALPGAYAPPSGTILLACNDEQIGGCIALRALSDGACEMKRLFIRPQFRGSGAGRVLVHELIAYARNLGCRTMRLDTLPTMGAAIALYRSMGFREIAPYYHNPVQGALFLELQLA